jgi:hypothetical protein
MPERIRGFNIDTPPHQQGVAELPRALTRAPVASRRVAHFALLDFHHFRKIIVTSKPAIHETASGRGISDSKIGRSRCGPITMSSAPRNQDARAKAAVGHNVGPWEYPSPSTDVVSMCPGPKIPRGGDTSIACGNRELISSRHLSKRSRGSEIGVVGSGKLSWTWRLSHIPSVTKLSPRE